MYILGLSGFYHDSAASLLKDGELIAAAQEERFSRKKNDANFPVNAILYCLKEANLSLSDIEAVTFYDKPLLKFERLIETYLTYAPRGIASFLTSMPQWLKQKLFLKNEIKNELSKLSGLSKKQLPKLLFCEHHQSHAASAFFGSPYENASVLCLDGVGEWATSSVWKASGNKLELDYEIHFPHSLGLLYSSFTSFCGFKVNLGEYKLMGLAPYGEPIFVDLIKEHLIDIKDDGTFRLDMSYFSYPVGLKMCSERFCALFGVKAREYGTSIDQIYMDLARSIQAVTEEIVLKLARTIHREHKSENLCLAGGVALNCVANGNLKRLGPFKNIWIQPAAGDAGGAVGAAFCTWYQYFENERETLDGDKMKYGYLGPSYNNDEIVSTLDSLGAIYTLHEEQNLSQRVSKLLAQNSVVGWFQGRMEFGPRALGNRSILGNPADEKMQRTMNMKIKKRESFRPFAPVILKELACEFFDLVGESPYMLLVSNLVDNKKSFLNSSCLEGRGLERRDVVRSTIPAVTHVDGTARVQTVSIDSNPKLYKLLQSFNKLTNFPLLINTSFNVNGEPIVCSPREAYLCFMNTEMDFLVIGNFLLIKTEQVPGSHKVQSLKKNSFKVSRFLYDSWMNFGQFLGQCNTTVILIFLYYFLFTPIALLLRLLSIRILKTKYDNQLDTYRVINKRKFSPHHLERPF